MRDSWVDGERERDGGDYLSHNPLFPFYKKTSTKRN